MKKDERMKSLRQEKIREIVENYIVETQEDLAERLRLAEQLNARCVLETKTAAALEQSVAYLREMGFSV